MIDIFYTDIGNGSASSGFEFGTNAGKIYSLVQGVTKSELSNINGVIDIYRENNVFPEKK
jgi:hypothetical protein